MDNCMSVDVKAKNETKNLYLKLYLFLWIKFQRYFYEKGKYEETNSGPFAKQKLQSGN